MLNVDVMGGKIETSSKNTLDPQSPPGIFNYSNAFFFRRSQLWSRLRQLTWWGGGWPVVWATHKALNKGEILRILGVIFFFGRKQSSFQKVGENLYCFSWIMLGPTWQEQHTTQFCHISFLGIHPYSPGRVGFSCNCSAGWDSPIGAW